MADITALVNTNTFDEQMATINEIITKLNTIEANASTMLLAFSSTEPIDAKFNNYLSWDDIRFLINEGVDIGAHTRTHPHMTNLTNEEIKNEIEYSNKRFLEEN